MEYHNLCDKCGDLTVSKHLPEPYEGFYCSSCETYFPDGLESAWYPAEKGEPDWAGWVRLLCERCGQSCLVPESYLHVGKPKYRPVLCAFCSEDSQPNENIE